MTDTVIQARTVLQPGARSFGPVPIPASITSVGFVFSKANWTDPTVKLSFDITVVVDGVSIPLGGCVDEPGGGADLFEVRRIPSGAIRTAAANVTVVGGPLDTVISVRTLDGTEPRVLV